MVVTNVHAVSSAALGVHECEINGSGSDFSHSEKKASVKVSDHGATQELREIESVGPMQSAGVQKMEAITMVWTKKWLIAAYALYDTPSPAWDI